MPKKTFFRLPEEKRKRIARAAMEEFTHYCYGDSNVNRIIKDAAIPPGSFYQYFEDKKDIFFYLMEEEIVRLEQSIGDRRLIALYRDSETQDENSRLMFGGLSPDGARLFEMLSKAPDWVKRDWAFSVMLPRHRLALYRLDKESPVAAGSKVFQENQDFFVALSLAVNIAIGEYAEGEEQIMKYYNLFANIFWEGLDQLAKREKAKMQGLD